MAIEFESLKCNRRTALGIMGLAACGTLLPRRAEAGALEIEPGSWTLVLLPDTQVYARLYPQHYDAQTHWIVDHAASHNIRCVLHEGDITDNNVVPQWDNALRSMNMLNGVVPYAIAPGNHDYGPNGFATNRTSMFNETRYFGPDSPYAAQSSVGGFFESAQTDNSYHKFSDGKHDWLVLALEWGPRDAVVDWANKIVQANPDRLAMLVTHAYMYNDDTRYDWAVKGLEQPWNPHSYGIAKLPGESTNDGQQLWEKLVSRHKSFRFAFNGHVLGDGTGFQSSTGKHGNVVHQILANYQFNTEGGQGDMRLLEFKADDNTVAVRTYSPVLNRYDEEPDQQFTLKMDAQYTMPARPERGDVPEPEAATN
jgi:3',5'-cyclic AMP phosphodiesterase CpdA